MKDNKSCLLRLLNKFCSTKPILSHKTHFVLPNKFHSIKQISSYQTEFSLSKGILSHVSNLVLLSKSRNIVLGEKFCLTRGNICALVIKKHTNVFVL